MGVRILVIEDDEETLDYVANGLTELGHLVDRAGNGRDGLFLAADGSYDLLIVDRDNPLAEGPRHPTRRLHTRCRAWFCRSGFRGSAIYRFRGPSGHGFCGLA